MTNTRNYSVRTYRIIWQSFLFASVLGLAIGTLINHDLLITPLPFGETVSRYLLSINAVLFVLAMLATLKNLLAFEEHWTWQERFVSRGTVLFFYGAVLGTLPRAFRDGAVLTIGTPLVFFGLLMFLYGVLNPPVRFSEPPKK